MDEQTYNDLITAFSFRLTMETSFYWKKATKRLIEVSILDYALVSGCKDEYESGLDPAEKKEVIEAIIANEKKRDTHLFIPRLTVDERIGIMKHFVRIQLEPVQRQSLQATLNKIIETQKLNPIELLRNGFKMGFDLNNLTVNTTELMNPWTEFYRAQTIPFIDKWLNEINAST